MIIIPHILRYSNKCNKGIKWFNIINIEKRTVTFSGVIYPENPRDTNKY